MSYQDDQYNLKDKSNTELHDWIAGYKPGTAEYIAGVEESLRRVARMEELMEKSELPVWKRELTAMAIASLAIVAAIIAIVISY